MYNFLASWLAHNKEWLRNMFSAKLKAQANLFNICSISLNAVERLLNEVERFQRLIQQTFASGLVISSGPRSLHETHTRAPFWNDRMDRLYVYNKVGSLLAVFAALEVLNDEDEKPGRGKRRQWIRRRGERALRLWYSLSKTSHKKLLFSNSSMSVSIPSDFFSFFFCSPPVIFFPHSAKSSGSADRKAVALTYYSHAKKIVLLFYRLWIFLYSLTECCLLFSAKCQSRSAR